MEALADERLLLGPAVVPIGWPLATRSSIITPHCLRPAPGRLPPRLENSSIAAPSDSGRSSAGAIASSSGSFIAFPQKKRKPPEGGCWLTGVIGFSVLLDLVRLPDVACWQTALVCGTSRRRRAACPATFPQNHETQT